MENEIFKTTMKGRLIRVKNAIVERPTILAYPLATILFIKYWFQYLILAIMIVISSISGIGRGQILQEMNIVALVWAFMMLCFYGFYGIYGETFLFGSAGVIAVIETPIRSKVVDKVKEDFTKFTSAQFRQAAGAFMRKRIHHSKMD
jgi:hypothetical protein